MNLPWKKIGGVLLGIGKSGLVPIPGLPAVIEGIQDALAPGAGAAKLDAALKIGDALLAETVNLGAMTPDQALELKGLQTAYVNSYVAAKNIEAQFESDAKGLSAFIAKLKASHGATTPVTPALAPGD